MHKCLLKVDAVEDVDGTAHYVFEAVHTTAKAGLIPNDAGRIAGSYSMSMN